MNKRLLLVLTCINSMLLFAKPNKVIAKPIIKNDSIKITNSSNINTIKLTYNKVQVDFTAQDVLTKPKTTNHINNTKLKSDNKPKKNKDSTDDDDAKITQLSADANDVTDQADNAHYQKGIPKMFKITFYDPKVLGASTMPGGLYAGVAADLNVFPKGTRLKITLPDGTVLKRVVNDTGTFAYTNHYQLDIAYPNSSIPSYGTTMAKVEVLN